MSLALQWWIQNFIEGAADCQTGCANLLLPPATKLGQGYIFTGICDSVHGGWGHGWWGGMHGRGVRGGGHVWQVGMHGGECAWQGWGTCVAGGYV